MLETQMAAQILNCHALWRYPKFRALPMPLSSRHSTAGGVVYHGERLLTPSHIDLYLTSPYLSIFHCTYLTNKTSRNMLSLTVCTRFIACSSSPLPVDSVTGFNAASVAREGASYVVRLVHPISHQHPRTP